MARHVRRSGPLFVICPAVLTFTSYFSAQQRQQAFLLASPHPVARCLSGAHARRATVTKVITRHAVAAAAARRSPSTITAGSAVVRVGQEVARMYSRVSNPSALQRLGTLGWRTPQQFTCWPMGSSRAHTPHSWQRYEHQGWPIRIDAASECWKFDAS